MRLSTLYSKILNLTNHNIYIKTIIINIEKMHSSANFNLIIIIGTNINTIITQIKIK